MQPEKLLTPEETADLLRVTVGTLEVWRSTKAYPLDYVKSGGRVMYKPSDVAAFQQSRTQAGTGKREIIAKSAAPPRKRKPQPKPKAKPRNRKRAA